MRSWPGLATLMLAIAAAPADATEPAAWVLESRAAAQQFGGRLLGELTTALANSPVEAIRVCSVRAPQIAAEEGARVGASVGRTALRVRNPGNVPVDWQQRGLESFAAELAAGRDAASLEFVETTASGGVRERRWMKPIVTAPMCLACHGEALAPRVAAAVAAQYPADRATGFAAGELRGAFYVVWRDAAAD
jgi:hypothetical protein